MMNQRGSLLCGKDGQFELVCLLLAYCLYHARPSQLSMPWSELQNLIKGPFQNCVRSKSPFLTDPHCTREYAFDYTHPIFSVYGNFNFCGHPLSPLSIFVTNFEYISSFLGDVIFEWPLKTALNKSLSPSLLTGRIAHSMA